MRKASSAVRVQEVAPRDGLQIEPLFIPTEQKIHLINALQLTGFAKVEVTSFTSPKAIPSLADAEAVMRGLQRVQGVELAALVPNVRGCERALACGVDELNVVMSISKSHNWANLRMTTDESLKSIESIVRAARGHAFVNASLSTAFGCPFEGVVSIERVVTVIRYLVEIGVTRISLCDTTGMANPLQVRVLFETVIAQWPELIFTAHFHDTRGMGLANVLAAYQCGIDRFDSSLGGLGGCPFAPGASGNVCSEDLVHMFEAMGIDTGVKLERLIEISLGLPKLVGHGIASQVAKAGPWTRRYPMPGQPAPA